mmetsp:Transcript_84755/g.169284  ORF Transcript_84755/g.169284 Transcript_84755/m.169284 type:complete len:203 (-) Transcript_84755:260-868(-)
MVPHEEKGRPAECDAKLVREADHARAVRRRRRYIRGVQSCIHPAGVCRALCARLPNCLARELPLIPHRDPLRRIQAAHHHAAAPLPLRPGHWLLDGRHGGHDCGVRGHQRGHHWVYLDHLHLGAADPGLRRGDRPRRPKAQRTDRHYRGHYHLACDHQLLCARLPRRCGQAASARGVARQGGGGANKKSGWCRRRERLRHLW